MEPSFILALFRHGYKVRTSTLYHLLKGKRTSSVLLYGFLYENLRYFQLFPMLSETEFNKIVDGLVNRRLLRRFDDGEVQITAKGMSVIERNTPYYHWIDNYRFGKTDDTIWRLLQFTVQVVSNLSYTNKNYIPLEQSPLYQKQVKMYIKSMPKAQLIEQVKKEWALIFSCLPKDEANFLAQQFSGYQLIGKTIFQLMDNQSDDFKRFLYQKERLHHLLDTIYFMPTNSLIKELILPSLDQNKNRSTNETSIFLNTQLTVNEIAIKRGVKVSTIKDHLMELALTTDFPFDRFISTATRHYLFDHSGPYQEWVYRSFKTTNPELDYFEFRLYQIKKIREERDASQ